MSGLISGNNENIVKTRLDDVLYEEFDRGSEPGEIRATDSLFFKQDSTDRQAVTFEEHAGPGLFKSHAEQEVVEATSPASGNLTTKSIINYKEDMPVPREFFMDDLHNMVDEDVRRMGEMARLTQDKLTMRNTYADFSGNYHTTPDGQALYSNSHTTIDGSTVDNLETGALNAANLEVLVKSLRLQKGQNGELGGHVAVGLLTPVILHPDAMEITKSELKSGTGNNDLNYFSQVYPGLQVGASAFLDSTYNAETNADTSHCLIGRNHMVKRVSRMGLSTTLTPPQYSDKDQWNYRGVFREEAFPASWTGTVGSNGSA